MKRKSWGKRKSGTELTPPERHLLLTGDAWPVSGCWRDQGESWMRPFTLSSPAGAPELKELWMKHRVELLAAYKGKKRPWAAVKFDVKEQ